MNRIALPIETKVREFDGKLWLGLNLVRNDCQIILGSSHEIINNLERIKPTHYVAKDMGDDKKDFFKLLQNSGVSVLGLDTEGGVYDSEEQYASNKSEFLTNIDAFLAWGSNPANAIRKNYDRIENIYVTGNPRFDLLQPHLRYMYQNQSIPLNEQYGDYLLFNGNFTLANPYSSHVINKYEDVYGVVPRDKRTYANRTFIQFLDAIHHLQNTYPEVDIIIRPHPSEDNATYIEEFQAYDQIHIEDSGDVRAWIAGASVTLHHDCTTGIESALMGVPVVSYRPFKNEKYEMKLPQKVSKNAFTLDELTEYVSESLRSDQTYKLDDEQTACLKQYIHNVDESAAENICNVVDNLEQNSNKNYDLLKPSLKRRIERRVKTSRWSDQVRTAYDMVQKLGEYEPRKEQRQYHQQKFPGLEKEEIINRINEMRKAIDSGPVSVEKMPMTNDTFCIRPE